MGFYNLEEMEKKSLFPNTQARFIHTDNMTFAYWELEVGAEIPEHAHEHEQVSNVLEGEIELRINGKTQVCGPGHVAVFPSNASHYGKAVTKCQVIDVFYPVREDFR